MKNIKPNHIHSIDANMLNLVHPDNYTQEQKLELEYLTLVDAHTECVELGDDELIDRAQHQLEEFQENYPELVEEWKAR